MDAKFILVEAEFILLEEIYNLSNRGTEEFLWAASDMPLLKKYEISQYQEAKAIEGLVNHGFLRQLSGQIFEISAAGTEYVEEECKKSDSDFGQAIAQVGVRYAYHADPGEKSVSTGEFSLNLSSHPQRTANFESYEVFRQVVVGLLYKERKNQNYDKINIARLCNAHGVDAPRGWIEQFAEDLLSLNLLSVATNLDLGPDIGVSVQLFPESSVILRRLLTEDWSDVFSDVLENLQIESSEIDATIDTDEDAIDEVPAAGRIVPLDHNSKEYDEAVSALESVIEAFREDHHLDNVLGQEKTALLNVLEGGKELLKDAQVRVDALLTITIEPLRLLAKRYDQALVGALAAAAISALFKLIGLG